MSQPALEERHASWLELFFDLVIVAAVAQLAFLLHGRPGGVAVFEFAVLYYAIWSVWTGFTLYVNVVGDRARQLAMFAAMFGIAVMAAAVPQLVRGEPAAFILAYVACRLLSALSWKRSNQVMTEWPAVQQAVGVIPWVASLGFAPPARYWLWAAGLALDLVLSLVRASRPERLLAAERRERARESRTWAARLLGNRRENTVLTKAETDRPHLGERLGLFVIIVLGEAVAQLVNAAAAVPHWQPLLWLVILLSFALLVALWWLTLHYGSGAAPVYGVQVFALRLTMPAHFTMTGSIVVIAAGLGSLAGEATGEVSATTRWVLCAGAAIYFLTATVIGLQGGASGRWIVGWGLPAVIASLLLGLFGGALPAWALLAVVLVSTGWHVGYPRFAGRPRTSDVVSP